MTHESASSSEEDEHGMYDLTVLGTDASKECC
jgi:hypothetical protein